MRLACVDVSRELAFHIVTTVIFHRENRTAAVSFQQLNAQCIDSAKGGQSKAAAGGVRARIIDPARAAAMGCRSEAGRWLLIVRLVAAR